MINKAVLHNLRQMLEKQQRIINRMVELADELEEEKEEIPLKVVKPARHYRVINSFVWEGVEREEGDILELTAILWQR